MMVFDGMALTRASLGFGDLPARNVPQDALLGILPRPMLAVRVIMVGAAAAAAWAGWQLGRSTFGRAAAMTVAVWNPFVVERLLQGQWSLVAAAWLLPAVALCWSRPGLRPAGVVAQWVCSLTPTGAIAAALCSRGRLGALTSAVTCAPWVVAGALATGAGTSTEAGAAAFAPRAEGYVGTLGALVGLGGIWNAHAVPPSRAAGLAVFGVALFLVVACAWRAVPRRWLVLAGLGFAVALASWAGWLTPVVAHVPGGGLLRDAQKWLILAIPAFVAAAGAVRPRLAPLAVGLALLQVPDAPLAVAALVPTTVEVPSVDACGRDVLFVDRPALITLSSGTVAVDPAPKAMNTVESGALRVDGVFTDPPSPRWSQAHAALGAGGDPTAELRNLDIGVVVYPDGRAVDTGAPARGCPPLGVALFALWCAAPLLALRPGEMRLRNNQ